MNIATETAKELGMTWVAGVASMLTLPPARAVLPQVVVGIVEKGLVEPLYTVRGRIVRMLPAIETTFSYGRKITTNWTLLAVAATLEELVFRYLIQSVLLRKVPKVVLSRIAPGYETLLDHKIAKIARIVLTATLFALVHVVRMGHLPGMLAAQFVSGLYFSYLCENSAAIGQLSAIHLTHNVILALIAGGVNEAPIFIDN